jgi:hypothetical protein
MSAAVSHRPTPLSSALALVLAAGVALLLAGSPTQRLAVIGTAVGVAVVVTAARLPAPAAMPEKVTVRKRAIPTGSIGASEVTAVGAGIVVLSLLHGFLTLSGGVGWARLGPGVLGVVLLGLGLRPVRDHLARRFVSAGLAALVVGVVLVGIFERADPGTLLVAATGAIIAWDVAEHGISLGEQLRTDADTTSVELVHAGASAGFGALLVLGATVLFENGATELPLVVLLGLVVAAVVSMAALYR